MEGKKSPSYGLVSGNGESLLQLEINEDTLETKEVFDWLDEFSREVAAKNCPPAFNLINANDFISSTVVSFPTLKDLEDKPNQSNKKQDDVAEGNQILTTLKSDTFIKPGDLKTDISEAGSSSPAESNGNEFSVDFIAGQPISPSDFENGNETAESNSHDKNQGIYKTPRSRIQEVEQSVVVEVETTPKKVRNTPLPLLNWADNEEIWQNIVYKEEATLKLRNVQIFDTRSAYLPRMRAILLDWIMEVCEVYHLRRNTYYLAVDYIDRYLTIKPSVPKTQLQLLGISCLFIAAKLDEIYPPKLSEFSYVCDGACTEEEILSCEILLLNALGWEVNPLTPSGWLNLYMQIHNNIDPQPNKLKLNTVVDPNFQYPQYSAYLFVCASHLMDLFSMDPTFLRFSYSTIAAAAIYFIYGKKAALAVSGLKWRNLSPCVNYMSIFHRTVKASVDPRLSAIIPEIEDERLSGTIRYIRNSVPRIIRDENHCVQTHLMDLDYFEKSIVLRIEQCGITVGKVFVRKVKTENGEVEYETTEDVADQTPPCVVMYELSPAKEVLIEHIVDSPPLHPTDPDYELGKINIFALTQKTIVTFDDILASLHNDFLMMKFKHIKNGTIL